MRVPAATTGADRSASKVLAITRLEAVRRRARSRASGSSGPAAGSDLRMRREVTGRGMAAAGLSVSVTGRILSRSSVGPSADSCNRAWTCRPEPSRLVRLAQMSQIALVFPGQGSQAVGMGRTLADASPAAAAVFAAADRALGERISEVAWDGPAERLDM